MGWAADGDCTSRFLFLKKKKKITSRRHMLQILNGTLMAINSDKSPKKNSDKYTVLARAQGIDRFRILSQLKEYLFQTQENPRAPVSETTTTFHGQMGST